MQCMSATAEAVAEASGYPRMEAVSSEHGVMDDFVDGENVVVAKI